ncbi:nucleotide cyclase [Paraphysoderma sedebokerense]|nr:nucleotide cyclase [Paraphysoderma sedebokerense]
MTSPSPNHLSSSNPIPTSGNVLSGFEPLEPIIPDEQPDVTPFERLIPNFVSKHVRQYVDHLVSENKLSNAKPIALEGFAAVVMADVSGYSTLTSFLADRGPDGTEILSRIMKEYVDKIIQIISLHGGDIVKFVGDAVLFYWSLNDKPGTPIENDPRRKGFLVIKACECCLDLLKKLKNYQVVIPPSSKDKTGQPTTKELKIHLGVGAGRIFDVHVGGEPGRWEHFIVGDAMEQLATVLDLAKAGQLAVSKRAFELIRNLVHVGMLDFDSFDTKKCYILNKFDRSALKFPEENYDTDALDLEASIFAPPTTASLSSRNFEHYKLYVNESALFKLESDIKSSSPFQLNQGVSHLMSLNELRQVTTVFIKVGSLSFKEALAKCQRAMTLVQVALRKHEGILRQFHVDDKGAIILAFFGLPPLSHNNDALQGIQAGLEICEGFNKEDADFSVGITTGVISIGGVGNSLRTEYALMGDSINMAARLMCLKAAENSIICDERSYLLCQREFDFDHLGQTTVKGKTQPISIFLPLKRRPDAEQNSKMLELAMLGRQNEKKLVNELFERHVKQSHTFCKVIVEGDGGQGVATFGKYIKTTAEGMDYCIW